MSSTSDWHNLVTNADLEGVEDRDSEAEHAMAQEEAWCFATVKDFEEVVIQQGVSYVKKVMDPSILEMIKNDC